MIRAKFLLLFSLLTLSTARPMDSDLRLIVHNPKEPVELSEKLSMYSEDPMDTLALALQSNDPAIIDLEEKANRMVDLAVEEYIEEWWNSFESNAAKKTHVLINIRAKILLKLDKINRNEKVSTAELERFFEDIATEVLEVYEEETMPKNDFYVLGEKIINHMINIKNDFLEVEAQNPVVEYMKTEIQILDNSSSRKLSKATLLSAISPNPIAETERMATIGEYVPNLKPKMAYGIVTDWMTTLYKKAAKHIKSKQEALEELKNAIINDLVNLKNKTLEELIQIYDAMSKDLAGIWNKHIEELIKILSSEED